MGTIHRERGAGISRVRTAVQSNGHRMIQIAIGVQDVYWKTMNGSYLIFSYDVRGESGGYVFGYPDKGTITSVD